MGMNDPSAELAKQHAERRNRFKGRKKKAAEKKVKEARDVLACQIPACTPRDFKDLSPPLQKITLFGTGPEVKPVDTSKRRGALKEGNLLEEGFTMDKLAASLLDSKKEQERQPDLELDLSQACLNVKGAAFLARALYEPRMKNLEVLELQGNYTG